MADIKTHPDPDVLGVVEYLISQVEHIKPESKSSIDETIAEVAAASSSTVETVQKKKRALRDRTNISAATTTADCETPKKRGRKRKSDELPSQPQPPTTTATTTTARSTRSAEKRKHEDENQPEDDKENAVPPPVTKRQRTPRKQNIPRKLVEFAQHLDYSQEELKVALILAEGAQLRAQHKPELEEQMPPRPSHTEILPPGEETGSLECECYPDPAYDRQMKQLPLLSEFVTNNSANHGICHDIPPQIASSNMTFNRLTTQAQFAFGQAYEVYTDECGLTVCYSAAPPIQHCINEIESLMDDSKTSAAAAAEEEEESTQVEVENRVEDDNDKENKKEVAAKEEKPKKSNSGLRFDSPIPDQENQRQYIYNGSNLSLFGGPTLVLYAFNVARSIFTNDELSNGLLPDEKLHVRSSNKKFLDPERIEVLKEAIAAKFNTTKDMVPWKELRAKLNSKFGYLTRKSKELRKASSASNSSIVS